MPFCQLCQHNPCLWDQYGDEVLADARYWITMYVVEEGTQPTNAAIQNRCYRTFTFLYHGYLGRGVRREIVTCVVNAIREEYSDDEYMGYRSD